MMRRSQSRAADPDAAREYARKRHALGRFGKPEEIANGITHLLSDEASFTTGDGSRQARPSDVVSNLATSNEVGVTALGVFNTGSQVYTDRDYGFPCRLEH